MESLDYHYLELQFMERVYRLKGGEFQFLVEEILRKKYPEFEKVRPYGSYGDGGNDGFRRNSGIYYQVYAPLDPAVKDAEAAIKFREDFIKLYDKWNDLVEIKEYNFVFNDQFRGTNIPLEQALGKLSEEYNNVRFNIILSHKLQDIFMSLKERDMISLHFNIDRLKADQLARTILELAVTELDKENVHSAKKILDSCEPVVRQQKNKQTKVKYATLQAKCFQKLEEHDSARLLLKELVRENPESFEAHIALAELYLAMDMYEDNKEQLDAAMAINSSHPSNYLCMLARKLNLDETVLIDESHDLSLLGSDSKLISAYYRLAGIATILRNQNANELETGLSYIRKAITHNTEKFENYRLELQFRLWKTHSSDSLYEYNPEREEILKSIDELIENFGGTKALSTRANLHLSKLKGDIYASLSDIASFFQISREIVSSCLKCYFDESIDSILAQILSAGKTDQQLFDRLYAYLVAQKKRLSSGLTEVLITHFNYSDSLGENGEKFFREIGDSDTVDFIRQYISGDTDSVIEKLNTNKSFALIFIDSIGNYSEKTEQLIEPLYIDDFTKNRLRLHLCYNSNQFESAFEIVKDLDITKIGPTEIIEILEVSRRFDAWDIEISLLQRLSVIRNNKLNLEMKYKLFDALIRASKYNEAIALGQEILGEEAITADARQFVFHNTLFACYERNVIDAGAISIAIEVIDKFSVSSSSFASKISVMPEILILDSQYTRAYMSIVEAIEEKNGLTENEYARLYLPVYFKIGAGLDRSSFTRNTVRDGDFVQLRESGQWYRLGDLSPLDTILIESSSEKYEEFLGKQVGDEIDLSAKFSRLKNNESISSIVSIEGYIYQKILVAFQRLLPKDLVPGVHQFEAVNEDGELDKQGLANTLKLISGGDDLFEKYCSSCVPFAFLATNQGGFVGGIHKLLAEGRGYINSSNGSIADFEQQVSNAKRAVLEGLNVYLEGTAAAFMVEHGLLEPVTKHLPNLKVPQSVVSLFSSLADRFSINMKSEGRLGLENGELFFRENDSEACSKVHTRMVDAVKYFEKSIGQVPLISAAIKSSEFIEQSIRSEFSDASILARRDSSLVMTDDYMYLRAAESLLGYTELPNISSIAFIRALYELAYISFLDYLRYFYFLSSYRFRFLHVFPSDIVTAVLGDGLIKEFNPNNIQLFNFRLTLSEAYGVDAKSSAQVISLAVTDFVLDESVTFEMIEKICIEIFSSSPDSLRKSQFVREVADLTESNVHRYRKRQTILCSLMNIRSKLSKVRNLSSLYP